MVARCLLAVSQEDSSVTERRAAVRNLYDKIKMAIDDVQYKQEKVKRKDHEGDTVRTVHLPAMPSLACAALAASRQLHEPALGVMESYCNGQTSVLHAAPHSRLLGQYEHGYKIYQCVPCTLDVQVLLGADVLALAVMTDLLSGEQRRHYTDLIDSPYMPALRAPVPLSHVDRPKKLPTAPQVGRIASRRQLKAILISSSVAPKAVAISSCGAMGAAMVNTHLACQVDHSMLASKSGMPLACCGHGRAACCVCITAASHDAARTSGRQSNPLCLVLPC